VKILIEIRMSRFRLVIELKEANQAVCGVDIARRLQLQTVEDFRAQGVRRVQALNKILDKY